MELNHLEKQVARLRHAIFPLNKHNLSLSKAKNFLSKWQRPFQTNGIYASSSPYDRPRDFSTSAKLRWIFFLSHDAESFQMYEPPFLDY